MPGGRFFAECLGEAVDEGSNLLDVRLLPPPLHAPPAGLRFLGHGLDALHFEQRATERHLLGHAELHELLHAIDLRQAAHVVEQHLRLVRLGLDQGGGKLGAGDWQHVAFKLAAQRLQVADEVVLQRAAVGVVRRDEEPALAEALHQFAGDRGGVHRGGVADAVGVPLAVGAGDRVGVAAGHDVQHLLLGGDGHHGVGDTGVHVAQDGVDIVALDQLAGFLDAGAGVVGGVFYQQLNRPAEDAALLVQILDGPFGAFDLAGGEGGQAAGDRIDHADPDRGFATSLDDERRGQLQCAQSGSGADHRTAADCQRLPNCHVSSPINRASGFFVIRRLPGSDGAAVLPFAPKINPCHRFHR